MTRVLVPAGALGLGFDPKALARGISLSPDIIAIDGGSTDSGPAYLGRGQSKYSRSSTKSEWAKLIEARQTARCPLIIGTAGTCGTNATVDWLYDITCEILTERGWSAKIARLYCEQSQTHIAHSFQTGQITPLSAAPDLSEDIIVSCTNIVALAGVEQIQSALSHGPDIIIAGRTTDTAIIAALPIQNQDHLGGAWHGAKIGECGALCSTNPMSGVVLIDFDATGFTIQPMAQGAICTPHTVSAHMLYENANPFQLYEPGGYLDVTTAIYTQVDTTSVRVEGSIWTASPEYTVKLEGARNVGYQTVSMVTLRDPVYVSQIDAWCGSILKHLNHQIETQTGIEKSDYTIELRQIGRNGTLGALEADPRIPSEVGIVGIITAPSQALANEIAKMLNPFLLHHPLTDDEPMPTFAFPFSPPEMERGAAYEFCLNHVLQLNDPMDAFEIVVTDV